MSGMVERVAKAAYEKFNEGLLGDLEPHWDDLELSFKCRMMAAQRAAIEAMREPTQAMIDAGFDKWNDGCCPACGYDGLWPPSRPDEQDHPGIWRRMIGAALGGPN